jgi:hypothetical protein
MSAVDWLNIMSAVDWLNIWLWIIAGIVVVGFIAYIIEDRAKARVRRWTKATAGSILATGRADNPKQYWKVCDNLRMMAARDSEAADILNRLTALAPK